jgi:hypothetical protein
MKLHISAAVALVVCGCRATAFIVTPVTGTPALQQPKQASSTMSSRLQAAMTMDSTSNTRRQLFGTASKAAAAILVTEIRYTLPAFANDPAWGPQVRRGKQRRSIHCRVANTAALLPLGLQHHKFVIVCLKDSVRRWCILYYFMLACAVHVMFKCNVCCCLQTVLLLQRLTQGDPKSARSWYPLLKAGDAALQDLLDNWENIVPAESTNGDVRMHCFKHLYG